MRVISHKGINNETSCTLTHVARSVAWNLTILHETDKFEGEAAEPMTGSARAKSRISNDVAAPSQIVPFGFGNQVAC